MKRVIFLLEKLPGTNQILYPDNRILFGNTERIGADIIADYSGELPLTEYVEPVTKSIYSNADFMEKIPSNKLKQIQGCMNESVEYWLYMVQIQPVIDLNNLPAWFTTGLQEMVYEGIFTQEQMNNFLEI